MLGEPRVDPVDVAPVRRRRRGRRPRRAGRPTSPATPLRRPSPRRLATRRPRSASVSVPRPASQPSTRGRLSGSRGSWPLATSNQRATSRTERARHPTTSVMRPCGVRRHRHAGVRRLEPDEAAEAGRDADRPAAVAARGHRQDAAGDRRCRPARRAARRAVRAATGCASCRGGRAGEVDAAELRRRRLAGEHDPTDLAQPVDVGRRGRGDVVLEAAPRRGCTASRPPARAP